MKHTYTLFAFVLSIALFVANALRIRLRIQPLTLA